MLKHTTTAYKDKTIKFYCEHNPEKYKEYNSWIKSFPGVLNVNDNVINETTMERVIEFSNEDSYKKWLGSRKTQESWVQIKQYESEHGISVSGKNELILYSEDGIRVAIPRQSI